MTSTTRLLRSHGSRAGRVAALVLLACFTPSVVVAQDSELFSAAVPPNVMLVVDNSGSMNHVVWHPAFDPEETPSCSCFDDSTIYVRSSYSWGGCGDWGVPPGTYTVCGNTREIFEDPSVAADGNSTRWSRDYLNWYFSDAADAYASEIADDDNGVHSQCLIDEGYSPAYPKYYGVSRVRAARRILRDVICQVNANGEVRFGIARFEVESDPDGGFVSVPIDDYSPTHGAALEDAIEALEGETYTPLGETLYNVYRYFQSRSNPALGKDGLPFDAYAIETDGSSGGSVPPSPLQYSCQKNFVLMITDGEPTKDDFDYPMDFDEFDARIGDYNPDNATSPENGDDSRTGHNDDISSGWETALFLDDIAMFMNDSENGRDFQLDVEGVQTLDVYTVGFTTSAYANDLLQKTANVGNGLFFHSNNAEELSGA
ncbi:MAG: hypothetical protein HRU01_25700, partial [Myxococcales bacterium]|nr:hypothetical protein [Myxococcales bacterium]